LSPSTGSPFILAEKGVRFSKKDLATTVAQLEHTESEPWLVRVRLGKQTKPPLLIATLYLRPHISTSRLRRGKAVTCHRYKAPKEEWTRFPQHFAYAQVAVLGSPFTMEVVRPSSAELPFAVDVALSDDDIVEIVDLVRRGPRLPTTMSTDGSISIVAPSAVEASNVIVAMEQKGDGVIVVRTQRREGAGQLITVRRQGDRWKLTEIANWVA
jgi:hypothetical protein